MSLRASLEWQRLTVAANICVGKSLMHPGDVAAVVISYQMSNSQQLTIDRC
ncbi:hypothetical protein PLANPX_5769 [Lacipirellula parvula]|uniref:Uncharacterized protein n=1 Tax=Lacipirellula parvula TaxID=2650471 RepID=A0A5K7XJ84_9BACT|nr:hypothetical protein PLANPX_5769 [Lacipirellula parvula]